MSNEIKEMIERVLIQRNKTVDDMVLGEIRKIATENGIDTIITLNDKAIIQALKNFAEVKHGEWINGVENECLTFKNKADFVEVVRCKDCKHYEDKGFLVEVDKNFGNCKQPILFWDDEPKEVWETDYCSYGERK